jgi:hypothetical protein
VDFANWSVIDIPDPGDQWQGDVPGVVEFR